MRSPDLYLRRVLDGALDAVIEIRPDGVIVGWNSAATRLLGWSAEEAIGRRIDALALAAGHWPAMREAVGQRTELMLGDRAGNEVPVEVALTGIELDDGAVVVAFLRDLRPRRRGHDVPRAGSDDGRNGEDTALATVARATRRFARSTSPATAREAICAAAIEACDASIAYLAEPHAERGGLIVTAVAGAELRGDGIAVLPFDAPSAAIEAHRTGNPVFVADIAASTSASARTRASARELGSVSGLVAAVGGDGGGVLGVTWRHRIGSVSHQTAVMRLLADEAALALGRAALLSDLEAQARTDPLTGLPNRRAWDEALTRELATSSRDGRPVCVALTDLDDFKGYNDAHGHPAGDQLLRSSVSAWQRSLRAGDILARVGGDEFSALLPNCRIDGALVLAERLRASTPDDRSCSVGVVAWNGEETPHELISRADAALYAAKAKGRNRVVAQ